MDSEDNDENFLDEKFEQNEYELYLYQNDTEKYYAIFDIHSAIIKYVLDRSLTLCEYLSVKKLQDFLLKS